MVFIFTLSVIFVESNAFQVFVELFKTLKMFNLSLLFFVGNVLFCSFSTASS